MAVAFDAVGPSSAGATSAASAVLSWTHTNVGDGVALVVAVAVGDSNDAGVTMTAKLDPSGANTTIPSLGALIHSGAGTAGFIGLYGLPNVSSGAHTVTVTCSAAVDNMEGGSVSFTGADLTTAFSAQQSFNSASTATPSITFTGSTSGNMVTAGLGHGAAISSVTAGTSRWIRNVNVNSRAGNGAQATIAAGGSVTITWAAGTDWEGIAAVEVLATSAPPVPATSLYRPSWVLPRVRNLLRSPFLQAPVAYWPAPPVPVLTVFDAELGVDGVNVTQATMPATQAPTINGSGAYFRHDAATVMYDTLAYRVNVIDSQQNLARGAIESSKIQRLRESFRLKAWATGTRPIMNFRNTAPAVAGRLVIDSSRRICLYDAAGAAVLVGPVLDIDTAEYDFSLLMSVGTTTSNSAATLKVYERGTSTQIVGAITTDNNINLGLLPINVIDIGTNDATAGALNYVLDSIRVENDVTTEFDPITPSTPTGSGSGATVAAGSATGARVSAGSGSGTSTASGSAVGKRVPKADGSGVSVLAGSAVGLRAPKAAGSGTSTISGSAVGTRVSRGTATGSSTITGSAAGSTARAGAAAGTSTVTGTATGGHASQGTGSGAATATGSAAGTRTATAAASGTSTATGTATGTTAHSGSTAGSSTITGSASGEAPAVSANEGSGAGTSTISGSAVGVSVHQGTGAGDTLGTGTAAGSRVSRGTATGSSITIGTAAGTRVSSGTAAGASVISGSALGFAPIVGGKSGFGSGSTTCSGSASGTRSSRGSATGATTCSGAATGTRPQRGSAAGLTVGVGTTTGSAVRRGLSVGTSTITGTAAGGNTATGYAEGHTVCIGSAIGRQTETYLTFTLAASIRTPRLAAGMSAATVRGALSVPTTKGGISGPATGADLSTLSLEGSLS